MGSRGHPEDDVRLGSLFTATGKALWYEYEYDFGDGWEHVLKVEKVLDVAPAVRCTGGRMACPPEDCDGIWGYAEPADWARHDHADAVPPGNFENAQETHEWVGD